MDTRSHSTDTKCLLHSITTSPSTRLAAGDLSVVKEHLCIQSGVVPFKRDANLGLIACLQNLFRLEKQGHCICRILADSCNQITQMQQICCQLINVHRPRKQVQRSLSWMLRVQVAAAIMPIPKTDPATRAWPDSVRPAEPTFEA